MTGMLEVGVPEAAGPEYGRLRAVSPRETPAMDEIVVSVLCETREAAEEHYQGLHACTELRLAPTDEHASADVVLVLAAVVTDELLTKMERIHTEAVNPSQCVVLVTGPIRERHLPRLFGTGVVSVLARRGATARLIARAVITSHNGGAVLPETLTRRLVDETRAAHENLLTTQGLTHGGLTVREVDVLRLLAEGHDTAYIAGELRYSERTIKKIIQDLMVRHQLHNRAHAVSYALRVGAL
jgi:DNA-binding NarL/FixJ family response regulator